MNGVYRDLGRIASAVLASDDSIEASHGPTVDGAKHGLTIQHRNALAEISETSGGPRYRVLIDYTPSAILREGYTWEDVFRRTDIDSRDVEEVHKREAIESMVTIDLQKATEQEEEVQQELVSELSPIDSRYTTQEYGEEKLWNGFVFYDYLYPRENDFTTSQYRETVQRVHQEALVASRVTRDVLEIIPDDPEQGVGTDQSVTTGTSPAFH